MLLISTRPVFLQYFLNTAYKEFITEEVQYRGKNPTRPVTTSGQQKTHLEHKSKNKHIPFQNHYEKIQTIIQIFRLCNYQFTHYSAHQVNVSYSDRYNASHQMEDKKRRLIYFFALDTPDGISWGWGKKLQVNSWVRTGELTTDDVMYSQYSKATIRTDFSRVGVNDFTRRFQQTNILCM